MSKIARKPISLPETTKVTVNVDEINVEGPLGKMRFMKN